VKIEYKLESSLTNNLLTQEMAELYSNHYGLWGSKQVGKEGQRITLTPIKISKWLENEKAYIATARADGKKLIGYAIAVVKSKNKTVQNIAENDKSKIISWVTQLVVHENYRQRGIARTLLFSFWGFSNYYAWGILSSNPYAIRALESATKRRAIPMTIKNRKDRLISFGKENIWYIDNETEFKITQTVSKANTHFNSDISNVQKKLEDVQTHEKNWEMGQIEEGWEWFAFTFNDQERMKLTKSEIKKLLDSSDEIAQEAYSRMLMDSKKHKWSNHTKDEVLFIINQLKLKGNENILDFGCGIGRHAIEFSEQGFNVVGVDFAERLLEKANENSKHLQNKPIFQVGDCRNIDLKKQFDVVLCLYDVIGSFIDNEENIKIIENIYKHMTINGYCIISVMNYEVTEYIAKQEISFDEFPDDVFKIQASENMENTGNVFNPNFYAIDKKTKIIYRREQFSSGDNLPTELIVRDRRFTKDEICNLFKNVGFKIVSSSYVQAGKWNTNLQNIDKRAKEILLICKKAD